MAVELFVFSARSEYEWEFSDRLSLITNLSWENAMTRKFSKHVSGIWSGTGISQFFLMWSIFHFQIFSSFLKRA